MPLVTHLANPLPSFPNLLSLIERLPQEHGSFVTEKSEDLDSNSGFNFPSSHKISL